MTLAVSQYKTGSQTGTGSTIALQFGSNDTAGDSIIVKAISTVPIQNVTDTESNRYGNDGQWQLGTASQWLSIWRSSNITGGSKNTVTITLSGTGTRPVLAAISDCSANLVLDNRGVLTGSGTAVTAKGAPALGVNEIGFVMFNAGLTATNITAHPAGWVNMAYDQGGTAGVVGELDYDVVSTWSGVGVPGWTLSVSRPWVSVFVSYRTIAPAVVDVPTFGGSMLIPVLMPALEAIASHDFQQGTGNDPLPYVPPPSLIGLIPSTPDPNSSSGETQLQIATQNIAQILNSLANQQALFFSGESWGIRAGGITGNGPPGATNDSTTGVRNGTPYLDESTGNIWMCTSNTQGAAEWAMLLQSGATTGGLSGNF